MEKSIKRRVNICDLEENMGNFTIIGHVLSKSEIFLTHGRRTASAIVEDETGKVTLNLHENQVDQVEVGETIRISGVFTETNGGYLEISTWKDIETTFTI